MIDKNQINISPDKEEGYVLISAIWLLLLGASIIALIMVHNVNQAEKISTLQENMQITDAQDSAIETIVADILFNGPRSEFALLPRETTYQLNGVDMKVTVSNENGKIDLNQADIKLSERALQGLGINNIQRQKIVDLLQQKRKSDQTFSSMADVEALFRQASIENDFCPARYFTIFSGLPQPQPNQMEQSLAKALGQASLMRPTRFRTGNALRIEIQAETRLPLVATLRTSGLLDRPYTMLDWENRQFCSND